MLACYPVLSLDDLKLCKLVSRVYLVLYVSDKNGILLFLPCSHKNAVAQQTFDPWPPANVTYLYVPFLS